MTWARDVFSNMVQSVGWDSDSNELIIEFKNGTAWGYSGVDEAFADQMSKAASVGGMFHTEVKNQLQGRRLR